MKCILLIFAGLIMNSIDVDCQNDKWKIISYNHTWNTEKDHGTIRIQTKNIHKPYAVKLFSLAINKPGEMNLVLDMLETYKTNLIYNSSNKLIVLNTWRSLTDGNNHYSNLSSLYALDKSKEEMIIGHYKLTGSDLNFDPEGFVARQKYGGTAEIFKEDNELIIEMIFSSPDTKIKAVMGEQFLFRSVLDLNGDYMAGSYVLGEDQLYGFGSLMMKIKNNGDIKGHTVFSSFVIDVDFGMTIFTLSRE